MYIIKLDAIDSTNSYLKEMASAVLPKDYTTVMAEIQTKGRGQMGTQWEAETGKNLTASVFKINKQLNIDKQFYISMVVSLSIYKALETFKMPQLYIKWPNDILSANKKLCGILIENVIKRTTLQGSVIGFGLNVNQLNFENLPNATSMKIISGRTIDKEEVLSSILKKIKHYFDQLEKENYTDIKTEYESLLFRKGKPSTFKLRDDKTFPGIIKGIENNGNLKVMVEDEIIKTFDLKEVTLLY
ncbi:MAG: biotin--[acetyl-CoA-carboxylase] ligase [Winogradskyella sp.]|uniref:biotin--[acetyl-CoA-carboxylase] ligase n=1 Tax=Winogradskyella sp. TaxID=1883156 RepID=UPI00181E21F3|nr:biotin--[acetyl-CoA-carboxylase] ligase [Winogradskyella sp.]